MTTEEKIKPFAELLEVEQLRGLKSRHVDCETNRLNCKVTVKMGKKFAKVDVGTSGKYMVELSTGDIYAIKAYGVVHRGHHFGTLETIDQWDWSDYRGVKKSNNIYWRNIPAGAQVYDLGTSYTADGKLVFWHGHEALEARNALKQLAVLIPLEVA